MVNSLPQALTASMIAYEDDFLLIIDKPAGMLVHPTVSQWDGTLYDLVKDYYAAKGIKADIHPVSRLDKNTSGLVIFAKEPIIQFWLSQQEIVKEYLAIAQGHITEPYGIITAPIARKEGSIIERCVDYEGGKEAKNKNFLKESPKKGATLLAVPFGAALTLYIKKKSKGFMNVNGFNEKKG